MQNLILALVLLICSITDLREQKIYNKVLLPAFIFGFCYSIAAAGWTGFQQSILGTLVGLAILVIPFAMGGMGAGDVKLLAVIGAFKGPLFVFYTALGMGLAGGVMALAVVAYKAQLFNKPLRFLRGLWLMLSSGFKILDFDYNHEKIMLPYGLAIAIGVVGAFWWMR